MKEYLETLKSSLPRTWIFIYLIIVGIICISMVVVSHIKYGHLSGIGFYLGGYIMSTGPILGGLYALNRQVKFEMELNKKFNKFKKWKD